MAFTPRAAKDSVLTIVIGGSTSALSTAMDDSNFARACAAIETTTFKDADQEYIAGLKGSDLSFSGMFDDTTIDTIEGQIGASTNPTFQYSPASTASGRRFYKVGGVITNVSVSGGVAGRVDASVTVKGSGAVTSTNH